MAKTVQSSQTNVGGGCWQQNYFTDAVGVKEKAAVVAEVKAEVLPGITAEEKLFFETVYGESVGQGICAWVAVASVIMNRVGKYEWKDKCTSVTAVIEEPAAFSSYYDPKIKGPSAQFISAQKFLDAPTAQNIPENIYSLMQIVHPIYKNLCNQKNQITSILLFYYSPRKQTQPDYIARDLKTKFITQITVPGVSDEDFLFYTYTWLYEEYQKQGGEN